MTTLAGSVDLTSVLARLAMRRPVFHSEADFQHALAWEAHSLDPDLQVRLETHPEPGVRLDLLFSRADLNRHTAVELKYLTASWVGQLAGERFELKNHGARDVRAYDTVKDIGRLERFVRGKPRWNGVLVAVTNEPSFWRRVTHGRPTNADAFRLYDGVILSGTRRWGPSTGAGTMRGREAVIELAGTHALHWQDFSDVGGKSRGTFKVLVVEVPTPA